ncbi:nucleotidyl transferase AbiEii/AbiGii toxin family protein [Candidatus Hakubella thermalkaliphila]|nr:nucleotidyl transferase AbiEii/AbiGii toxin family protein [Candidatus Hakubella thermalkaliphila]GFP43579.1 hypothetical protein HKBW3C_02709 [Candidatus Hakubella thermalkaliphila]
MISKALKEVVHFLSEAGIPHMVIGGQAVLQYGEPRFTQDIDITIGLIPEELRKALEAFPQEIFRLLPEDVEGFVQNTWVLPIEHRETGVRVDLIFSMTPFEREAIKSAREILIDNMPIHYISPEDLIVQKIVSGRPRDLEDVRGMLEIQGKRMDEKRIEKMLDALAREVGEDEWIKRWKEIQERSDG